MGKKITPIEQEQQQTHQYLWQDAPTEKNSFLPNPFPDTTPAINKVSSKQHNVFILGGRKVSVRPRTISNGRQRKLGYFHEYSHIYWSVLCHWGHDIQKAVNADKKWHQGSKQKQVKLCNRTVELQTRYLKKIQKHKCLRVTYSNLALPGHWSLFARLVNQSTVKFQREKKKRRWSVTRKNTLNIQLDKT